MQTPRSPLRVRSARRALAAAVLAGALAGALALPAAGAPARQAAEATAGLDGVRSVLRLRWPDAPRTREEVVDELTRLGDEAVPALFDVYTGAGFEELLGDARGLDSWWTAPDRFGPLVLDALCACPPRAVLEHVEGYLAGDAPIERQLAAVRVLGALGAADGLAPLLAFSAELGPLTVRYRSVRSTLVGAMAAILARNGAIAGEVRRQVTALDDATLELLLEACGDAGRPAALRVLEAALDRSATLDARIVVLCAELHARSPWQDVLDVRALALQRLDSRDADLARAAAAALAVVGEHQIVPQLIELVGDPRATVATGALWALRDLAEADYGLAAHEWSDWYAFHEAAWDEQREDWERAVQDGNAAEARAAVRKLGLCRLQRHEAAVVLALAAARSEPDVRQLAHIALRELGSRAAVPALVEQLAGADDAQRAALFATLEALTGETLPREAAAWRARVEGA